jgi:cytochrome c oxidase subunit 3
MGAGSVVMPRRPVARRVPAPVAPVSNARLAIVTVLVAETMFFVGLIGAFLVFRLAAPTWPPQNLPQLPLLVTTLNTVVLLASLAPLTAALRAVRRDDQATALRALTWTAALGSLFLAVQGAEWVRLVGHGLTLRGSMYGATFYVLIGCHGLHVLAAVAWLAVTALIARRGRFTSTRHAPLEICAIYWYFVCGLWVVLFPLVYLY